MPSYENILTKDCRGCMYLSTYLGSCDYILIEGKRRPCTGGKGCTVKKIGPKLPPEDIGKKPKWDYIAAKKMWQAGKTDRQIAEAVGASREAVASYRRKNWGKSNEPEPGSVHRGPRKNKVLWDKEKGKEMYLAGATDKEIAEAMGVERLTVKSYRLAFWGPSNFKKEDRGRPVTWDTKKAEALFRSGMKDREIAEAVGTTAAAVGNYRKRHWGGRE